MKKNILRYFIAFSILLFSNISYSQSLNWVKTMGGTGQDYSFSIVVDGWGSSYTTGYFNGTVDFDPGPETFNLTSAGGDDIFICKLDSLGNFVWAVQLGRTGNDRGASLAIDNNANIYACGTFRDTVDFDPGAGVFQLISPVGVSNDYIVKLDSSGNFSWAGMLDVNADISSLFVDGASNLLFSGRFWNTLDIDMGAGTTNLVSAGGKDAFVCKMDAAGNFIWGQQFGGASNESCLSFTVDSNGDIICTGDFDGTSDFDPGVGNTTLSTQGSFDIHVTKLDNAGNFLWAKAIGGSGLDDGYAITSDNANNSYITGFFSNTVDFDPGAGTYNLSSVSGNDMYILKLDASGNMLWARQIGGASVISGSDIAIDGNGFVYTTGGFGGTADFNPGENDFNMTSGGFTDIFIDKLDANGNFLWAGQVDGAGGDQGNALFIDNNNDLYVTGRIQGQSDFDPDTTQSYLLNSNGGADVFVWKLSTCNQQTYSSINQSTCSSYSSPSGNYTWTSSGTYVDVLPNYLGCDSIITINLTIYGTTTSTINPSVCSVYTVPSGDESYSVSGIYYDTIPNINGCDSLITINLTVNSNTGTDVITACDSYTWIDGITYTADNTTATHTLTNANGCDSVVTLNLSIFNSTTGTDVITACDSYTWIDGITYTADNTTATHTLTNTNGCDSVVTLNLSIFNSTTGTDVITACDSYTWIDGITYTADNTTATHTLTNVNGCDSVVTLNLSIFNSTTGTDVITACDSYTWIDGITYTADNTTATYILTTVNGCDSVVTLNLTVNTVDLSVTDNSPVLTANAVGATYQWVDCINFTQLTGETGQSFTASTDGNYAVIVTQNGCSDTSQCYAVNNTGIFANYTNSNLTVFPNPTKGNAYIDLGQKVDEVEISVRNMLGQQLFHGTFSEQQFIPIEISAETGVYFIEISNNKGEKSLVKVLKN